MNRKVDLSIIVPIYGVEQYLEQCIESIMNQSFDNIEIILVDDGSVDNSPSICDQYAKIDRRIKVIHKINGGLVSARKAGVQIATGTYIGYVDGDDFISQNMYELMMRVAKDYDADVVISDIVSWGNKERHNLKQYFAQGYYGREKILKEIIPNYIGYGRNFKFGFLPAVWNKIYKRELLIKYQMKVRNDIVIGEDAAVFYPMMLEVNSLYYCKSQYLYKYRQIENSMSHQYTLNHLKNIEKLCQYLYEGMRDYFGNRDVLRQYIRYVDYMIGNGILQTYNYLFDNENSKKEILNTYNDIKHEKWWLDYCNDIKKYAVSIKRKLVYRLLETGNMRYAFCIKEIEKIQCIKKN